MPRRGEKLRKTWIGFYSILDRHGDDSVSNRDAVRSPDQRNHKLQYGRSRIADIEHVDRQQCQVDGEYSLCRRIIGGNLGARAASAGAVAPIGVNVIALLFLAVSLREAKSSCRCRLSRQLHPVQISCCISFAKFLSHGLYRTPHGGVSTCGTEIDTKNSGVNKFYFVAVNECASIPWPCDEPLRRN